MLALVPRTALLIFGCCFALGIGVGALTDAIASRRFNVQALCCDGLEVHEEIDGTAFDLARIKEQWKNCSAARGILAVVLVLLIAAVILGQIEPKEWNSVRIMLLAASGIALFIVAIVSDHFLEEHLWRHVAKRHMLGVFLWTLGARRDVPAARSIAHRHRGRGSERQVDRSRHRLPHRPHPGIGSAPRFRDALRARGRALQHIARELDRPGRARDAADARAVEARFRRDQGNQFRGRARRGSRRSRPRILIEEGASACGPAARRGDMDYDRIITHTDLDGIVSAAIVSFVYGCDTFIFAGPNAIARAEISIGVRDVVCDLPYPLECGLWFDHHPGNREALALRGIEPAAIPGGSTRRNLRAPGWSMNISRHREKSCRRASAKRSPKPTRSIRSITIRLRNGSARRRESSST